MEKDNHLHNEKREKSRFNIKLLVLKILAVLSVLSFIYIYIVGDGRPDSPFPALIMYLSLLYFVVYVSEDKIRGFFARKRKN